MLSVIDGCINACFVLFCFVVTIIRIPILGENDTLTTTSTPTQELTDTVFAGFEIETVQGMSCVYYIVAQGCVPILFSFAELGHS